MKHSELFAIYYTLYYYFTGFVGMVDLRRV